MNTHEQKVKAAYPMAFDHWNITSGQMCGWVIMDSPLSYGNIISEMCATPLLAWQSAANSLDKNIEDGTDNSK